MSATSVRWELRGKVSEARLAGAFSRPETGVFSAGLYRRVLEQVSQGCVITLTVSSGEDERIFFFTRGAILFLALGTGGGEVLARKLRAQNTIPRERLGELVSDARATGTLLQDRI